MTELGMRLREPDSTRLREDLWVRKGLRRAVSLVRDRTGAIEAILGRYELAEV